MSDVSPRPRDLSEVVIAVDPHKASWTAVVVNSGLAVVATIRVEANRSGYRQLWRLVAPWPRARWAIRGRGRAGGTADRAVTC